MTAISKREGRLSPILSPTSPTLPTTTSPTLLSDDTNLSPDKFNEIVKCISSGVDTRNSNGSISLVARTAKISITTLNRWIDYGRRAISHPEECTGQNPLYLQLVLQLDIANINLGQRIFTKLTEILLHGEVITTTQYELRKTHDEFGCPITYRDIVGYTETRKPATKYLMNFLDNMEPGKWFPERLVDGEHTHLHQHQHTHLHSGGDDIEHQELDIDGCPYLLKLLLLKFMRDGISELPEGLEREIKNWCGE